MTWPQPQSSGRRRAIHSVRMSAATEPPRTATSYSKSSSSLSRVLRSASAASLPVTNSVSGTTGAFPYPASHSSRAVCRAANASPASSGRISAMVP